MTLPPRPSLLSLIPESAPFSAEQRVWLNGLFAGLLSLEDGITPLSLDQAAALLPGALDLAAPATSTGEDDDGAPWHDPAMALADRMKLAEGRPLRRRMMAAMGQQDCGQCGYNCQDYSDAIFLQKEERLNLCVPGGKETTRTLKALHQELGNAPASAETPSKTPTPAAATVAPAGARGCSRECPTAARFLSRTRLNKAASEKETWHIEFDLTSTGIDYAVGDAFGVFPTNDPVLADAVIAALAAPPDFPIGGRAPPPTCCFSSSPISPAATGGRRRKRSPPARIRTATPPRSTCSPRSKNFPACVPIRKPSSRRSIRCSRGSIPSRARRGSIATAWRFASMRCATRSMAARGSASRPRSSASACAPETRSTSSSRRRSTSVCRPIPPCPSS